MNFRKVLCLSVCTVFAAVCFSGLAAAQGRERVVKQTGSRPVNQTPAYSPEPEQKTRPLATSRPVLTNQIIATQPEEDNNTNTSDDPAYEPLVKRTASSRPVNAPSNMAAAGRTAYGLATSARLDQAIRSRYGTPYRYGSTGPNTYDCSGFVWSAFQEAGINFTRASARSLWASSEPVYGDDRFKFGTLVFLNGLGHMGIVADENGFYHASSSKGITYSPFKGYWEGRIVGFRRLKPESATLPSTSK